MERIQAGQFSLEGREWEGVSLLAKDVIERLLTVDAQSRLTLAGLLSHPWLAPASAPTTPLQTSCVLGREKGTASAIKHTFHAFHQVSGSTVQRSLGDWWRCAVLTSQLSFLHRLPRLASLWEMCLGPRWPRGGRGRGVPVPSPPPSPSPALHPASTWPPLGRAAWAWTPPHLQHDFLTVFIHSYFYIYLYGSVFVCSR